MANLNVGSLGEYLREQRNSAKLSLRQLAEAAGVSNPYLSQIERGLRKPSAEILQQLAKGLRISAETLYVRAGILEQREADHHEVTAAILSDPSVTERQKRVLIDIYEAFREENALKHAARHGSDDTETSVPEDTADGVGGPKTTEPGPGTSADVPRLGHHD